MRKSYAVLGSGATAAVALLLGAHLLRSGSTVRQPSPAPLAAESVSCVVLKESACDLGTLDPSDKCRHVFVVRNDGDAPLKIAKAGTSCKCTVSVLPAGEIPPGMGGPIEIESKIDAGVGPFSHTAAFRTNDPRTPHFELTIRGAVRSYVAASPASIYLAELERGQPVETSTTITSEVWDAFTLTNVISNLVGLSWEFRPAPPEELHEGNARAGYVATFRLPAERAAAGFSGWVEALARPTGHSSGPRKLHLAIAGRVAPIRSVSGPQIDREGVVTIGSLRRGEGGRAQLLLSVRGDHRQIHVRRIEKTPDFINASVEPVSPELAKKGLYKIVIEVPRDAPSCEHMLPDDMGVLRVLTDHPEMPEIVKLKVAFAVLSR